MRSGSGSAWMVAASRSRCRSSCPSAARATSRVPRRASTGPAASVDRQQLGQTVARYAGVQHDTPHGRKTEGAERVVAGKALPPRRQVTGRVSRMAGCRAVRRLRQGEQEHRPGAPGRAVVGRQRRAPHCNVAHRHLLGGGRRRSVGGLHDGGAQQVTAGSPARRRHSSDRAPVRRTARHRKPRRHARQASAGAASRLPADWRPRPGGRAAPSLRGSPPPRGWTPGFRTAPCRRTVPACQCVAVPLPTPTRTAFDAPGSEPRMAGITRSRSAARCSSRARPAAADSRS